MFVAMVDKDGEQSALSPSRKVATETKEPAEGEIEPTGVLPKRVGEGERRDWRGWDAIW